MDCKAFPEGLNNNQKDGTSSNSERNALENNNIRFRVNYKEIENTKNVEGRGQCVELSENVLSTVPWKIAACKITKTTTVSGNNPVETNYLKIGLATTAKWSFDATGTIKLIPNEGKPDVSKKLENSFNGEQEQYIEILDWKNINDYTNNDELTFDFTVSISSLKRIPSSQVQQITTKFYVKVPNVETTTYSPEVSVAGIKWKVVTKKNGDFLAIYLYAVDEDMGLTEEWEVEFTSNLLSWADKLPGFSRTFKTNLSWAIPAYGFNKFIKWDELHNTEKNYVKADAALFQVELKVTPKST